MADLTPVSSGIIRGTFVAGVLDSADPGGEPDIVPMTGQVVISATTPYFRVTTTDPPMTVFPTTLTIPLNAEGRLEYNGSTDIALWATTDPDTNPTDWQWRVAFELQFNGQDVAYPSFNFTLDAAEVVDLTTAAPAATPSPGVAITQGPPGLSAYEIAVLEGFVGDEAAWIASLEGPPGSGATAYADMAAVDAVVATENGVVTVSSYDTAFASSLGAGQGGDAVISTIVDNGNDADPDTGTMNQQATWSLNAASRRYSSRRTRSKVAGVWGAWSAWAFMPPEQSSLPANTSVLTMTSSGSPGYTQIASTAATNSTIAQRTTAGALFVNTPTTGQHAVNRDYLNTRSAEWTWAQFIAAEVNSRGVVKGANLFTELGAGFEKWNYANDFIAQINFQYGLDGGIYFGGQTQRLYLSDADSGVVINYKLERKRVWAPNAWGAWGPWVLTAEDYAQAAHVHAAADITSGVLPIARLATGTPDGTKFLRDDGVLAVPAGGGGGIGVLHAMTPKTSGVWLQQVTSADYATGASAYASATVHMSPLIVGAEFDIDALGCHVTTLEAVETRLYLYASDEFGYPTNLVATASATPTVTGAFVLVLGAPVTVPPGMYWVAIRTFAGSTIRFRALGLTSMIQALTSAPANVISGNRPYLLEGDVGPIATPNDPIGAVGQRNDGTNLFPMVGLRRA